MSRAGGNHGKIFNFFEYPFSGGMDFQFHSAMWAGTTAKRICQLTVTLPLVSALGAGDNAFGRPAPDVLKTVQESILLLHFTNFR